MRATVTYGLLERGMYHFNYSITGRDGPCTVPYLTNDARRGDLILRYVC